MFSDSVPALRKSIDEKRALPAAGYSDPGLFAPQVEPRLPPGWTHTPRPAYTQDGAKNARGWRARQSANGPHLGPPLQR